MEGWGEGYLLYFEVWVVENVRAGHNGHLKIINSKDVVATLVVALNLPLGDHKGSPLLHYLHPLPL